MFFGFDFVVVEVLDVFRFGGSSELVVMNFLYRGRRS